MSADTFSVSSTRSYTTVDVGRVLDCFAADLDGIGQSTGLRSRENTRALAVDVKKIAVFGYLSCVCIYLDDSTGRRIRAARYDVTTEAGALSSSRPGNYLWPRILGGYLGIHVVYSQAWRELTGEQRLAFKSGLILTWVSSDLDTSFPMLQRQHDRNYVSSGYAIQKSVFA